MSKSEQSEHIGQSIWINSVYGIIRFAQLFQNPYLYTVHNRHVFSQLKVLLVRRVYSTFSVRALFYWVLMTFSFSVYAQHPLELSISGTDLESVTFINAQDVSQKITDQVELKNTFREIVSVAQRQGYLTASIDSITFDSTQVNAQFYLGKLYRWVQLRFDPDLQDWLSEVGIHPESFANNQLNPSQFERMTSSVLEFAENNGYPFANMRLDSVELLDSNRLSANLTLDKNRYFRFDTISIEGDVRISKNFLYQYLGFKPGEPYNEKLVRKIDEKLSKLPYATRAAKSKIFFVANSVRVFVKLKHRKTDQVDGIIGFAPNSSSDNTLLITGEVNIDLKNLLRRGIGYSLHWKSFAKESQQLKMATQLPFLFKSPLGVDANFDYVKFDTQFFNLRTSLGVKYLFEGTDYLKIYVQNNQSVLLFVDTSQIRQTRSIPSSNPVSSTSYGLKLLRQTLDVPYNPRKGARIILDANIGTRNLVKDNVIEQVKFINQFNQEYDVYDSIKLKTVQAELTYDIAYFFPVGKKSTLVPSISGKQLFAETIFTNDLYRFGGTKSLRGFNEESLQANSFTMLSLEYRYILGGNAYFQLFANGAYMENKSDQQTGLKSDFPYGFGAGVHLEVNTGILSLAYALGTEQGNPIKFSLAKIHFGIINYL